MILGPPSFLQKNAFSYRKCGFPAENADFLQKNADSGGQMAGNRRKSREGFEAQESRALANFHKIDCGTLVVWGFRCAGCLSLELSCGPVALCWLSAHLQGCGWALGICQPDPRQFGVARQVMFISGQE